MTNAFAFRCQKVLPKYEKDEEIALIIQDIANARQGVLTFSKEVKKYMLEFIHARYNENEEVQELIEILKSSNRYQSFAEFEIFELQDESFFWYDFLSCYAIWKIIQKVYGKMEGEEAIKLLVRLIRFDVKVFEEYKKIYDGLEPKA